MKINIPQFVIRFIEAIENWINAHPTKWKVIKFVTIWITLLGFPYVMLVCVGIYFAFFYEY